MRSRKAFGRRSVATGALGALICVALSACSGGFGSSSDDFEPAVEGVLTVATANIPAPGFWQPEGDGTFVGFEAGIADELADRLGLDEVRVIQIPFADLVAGKLGEADIGISQITATPEREKNADFTTPYEISAPAILARKGTDAIDASELQQLRWAMTRPSTFVPVLEDRIRPDAEPEVAENRAAALELLRRDEADAYFLDLPVALGIALAEPEAFEVIGQLSGIEGLAVVLANHSANLHSVDAAIRAMKSDGTLADLEQTWFGGAGREVPLIRVTQ